MTNPMKKNRYSSGLGFFIILPPSDGGKDKSELIDDLAQKIENFFEGIDDREIEVALNINVVENGENTALDGDGAILEVDDGSDGLVVPDGQNDDTPSQGDIQGP